MKEAVIVSTARTPLGKAYRGAFNMTQSPTLAGWAIREAVSRAGVAPEEIEDVVLGCAMPQGTSGVNIGRIGALAAGLPVTVAGMTIDRQCSSGMMALATAARQIIHDGMKIAVGGGVESISLVQNEHYNSHMLVDKGVQALHKDVYMPMLGTAETVAQRYGISREAQDEYGYQSQMRTAAAQAAGKFDDEIIAVTTTKAVMDKATKEISYHEVTLDRDEGNRPNTTLEGLANVRLVNEGGTITAGNASQMSDGASACVLMDSKIVEAARPQNERY